MTRHTARAPSQRQLRVGEEIRHVMADILGRGELRDPDLADLPITVTEVRASPDLRNATVYVMPLGGRAEGAVVAALNRASAFLRGRLGRGAPVVTVWIFRGRRDTGIPMAAFRLSATRRSSNLSACRAMKSREA